MQPKPAIIALGHPCMARGTGSSNPFPSSGESAVNSGPPGQQREPNINFRRDLSRSRRRAGGGHKVSRDGTVSRNPPRSPLTQSQNGVEVLKQYHSFPSPARRVNSGSQATETPPRAVHAPQAIAEALPTGRMAPPPGASPPMRMTASWSGPQPTYRIQVCGVRYASIGELPSDHTQI